MSHKNKRLVITSALPYVNNVPHLGNVVGCVLSADVYARYMRTIEKRDVLFIGGVDEYGTATEMKARELGISCKELCDKNYDIHKTAYDWFKISFDCYGRTSQPNGNPLDVDSSWPHTTITHEIYEKLVESDVVIECEEVVWYCDEINAYIADRFIISDCYHCGSTKADGDQCDTCGNLLDTAKLVNPRYKPNPSFTLSKRTTSNLYLDLPKIWSLHNMDDWFKSNSNSWTGAAESITSNWLSTGLKPRSITRDLKWGTRVPDTQKFGNSYASKVFYVWFDAPIGYLSIMEKEIGKDEALQWWNKDNEVVQFMAKDNVPFHSIIFPATLAPLENTYELSQQLRIASTDYLMYEGQKFSKSKNTGLFCDDVMLIAKNLNIDSDFFRLYLIYIRPETGDSNFVLNKTGFVDFVNSILINNLGNMCHRVRSILYQYGVKHTTSLTQYDSEALTNDKSKKIFVSDFYRDVQEYKIIFENQMKDIKLRDGLKTILDISSRCNLLINDVRPWEYVKLEKSEIPSLFYDFIVSIYCTIIWIGQNIESFAPGLGSQIQKDFTFTEIDNILTIQTPKSKPNPMFSQLEYIDYQKSEL